MAVPTVVGTTVSETTSWGSTVTAQTPAAASSSSTLLAWFSCPDSVSLSNMGGPSGWQLIGQGGSGGGPPRGKLFLRPANLGTPASSYGFTKPSSPPASVTMLAINNVDPDSPVNASASFTQDSSGTNTLATSSRTTTADDCLLVCVWAATPYQSGHQSNQWSGSVSSTDGVTRTLTTSYQSQQAAWQARPTAGSTGTRTGTFSNTSGSPVGKLSAALALNGVAPTGGPQTFSAGLVIEYDEALPTTLVFEGQPVAPVVVGPTAPVTLAQRQEMLQASTVSFTLSRVEVLSQEDEIEIEDISGQVVACRIEHGSQRNIHRIIEIETFRELDWGRQRIKPYLTVEGGDFTDTLPLGVFCMTAPTLMGGQRPARYSVQGYDKMYLIDQPLAQAASYPTEQPILASVRDLLSARSIQVDRIDTARSDELLTQVHAWGVEQGFTYLSIVNDLLAMVGYRHMRIDRDGFPEAGPHAPADQRPVMWRYDSDDPMTTVHLAGREHVDDFTDRPNRWVFWINHSDGETPPVEGDGLYTVDNLSQGRSSQSARGGLVITRAEAIEAATQADLEANGNRIVAEDMESSTIMRMTTDLNPYHDHQDVMEIVDRDLGIAGLFESLVWSMDIFARTMTHEVRSLPGGIA